MSDLSPDEVEAMAASLEVLAEFYRARPKIGYVSPSVYRRLLQYGSDRFGSSERAADGLTDLAAKVRATVPC